MEQMSIFDFVEDTTIKKFPVRIKYQHKKTGARGSTVIYTDANHYGAEIQKWKEENLTDYYYLGFVCEPSEEKEEEKIPIILKYYDGRGVFHQERVIVPKDKDGLNKYLRKWRETNKGKYYFWGIE